MRLLIFLFFFINFFNLENNKLYSISNQLLFYTFLDYDQKATAKLIYKDGFLNIEGLDGNANVSIYTIIGNKVANFSNMDLKKIKVAVALQSETMYIARIEFSNTVLTYKFFTR